jgi:predicted ABC-type ATPase
MGQETMQTNDNLKKPIVLVFAGPNGSGKTTVTNSISTVGTYVNADDLKNEFKLTDIEAAEAADLLRNELLNKGADFSFETVLSTERNLLLMQKAKAQGYEVKCVYVLTCDENINILRVKERVRSGGHDVPEDKIRSRYHRALTLLPKVIAVCDNIIIYDNSDTPYKIFSKGGGRIDISPNEHWTESDIRKLIGK